MNPGRSEILSLLRLLSLKSYNEISDIDIQSILKYNSPFELTDDLQIPYVGYVKSLISDGTGSVKKLPFTDADFVDVDGSLSLPLPFTGSQISLGLISRAGITDDLPSGDLVNNLSGGQVESYNGLNGGTQYGIVYYVGDAL